QSSARHNAGPSLRWLEEQRFARAGQFEKEIICLACFRRANNGRGNTLRVVHPPLEGRRIVCGAEKRDVHLDLKRPTQTRPRLRQERLAVNTGTDSPSRLRGRHTTPAGPTRGRPGCRFRGTSNPAVATWSSVNRSTPSEPGPAPARRSD